MAVDGSCSQALGSMPTQPRTSLTRPSWGLYIHSQNCETTVEASRNGMKNESRQTHWPLRFMLTRVASRRATTTSGMVLRTVNTTVFHSDFHISESPKASE